MSELRSGNIVIRFKRPQGNGRAAMELTPMALMRRLASLVPPPGSHDTTYHGVFAAHARLRKRLVRPGPEGSGGLPQPRRLRTGGRQDLDGPRAE